MNQRGLGNILTTVVIFLLILVGVYFYMGMRHPIKLHTVYNYSPLLSQVKEVASPTDQNGEVESTKSSQIQAPEGWKIYTHPIDGYSFLYPNDWHLLACSNGYYEGNIHISPKPIEDKKCVAENMEEAAQAEISMYALYDTSVTQQLQMARKDAGFIADFLEKSTEINGRTYPQMLYKLKIIPPWAIPATAGVTTYIEVPERQQTINVGRAGLDDDSESADIYRQVISTFEILDTLKPTNYPKL